MNDKRTGCTPARIATTVAISLLAAGPGSSAPALARGAIVNLKQELASTGADSDARGKLRFVLKTATEARLVVQAGRLSPEASFDVLADGVKVGTISTTGGGGGKLRLRSVPRAQDEILGFDPRGTSIVVRDEDGDDVLAAMVADDTIEPGKVACCIPDDSGSECEDRTADECVAQGGTVTSSTTCLPNPCDGATTPGRDVVCCIPDDSGPECEDRTPEQCAAQGGTATASNTCLPNPCEGAPGPDDADIVCCIPDDSGAECEDRTAAECAAQGGTVIDATSCAPNPCAGTPAAEDEIACCLPHATPGEPNECETETPATCAALGGTATAATSCTPDPCNP